LKEKMPNKNLQTSVLRWRGSIFYGCSLGLVLFSGCAFHPPVHPDLANRLSVIRTVAVSPPYLVGYSQWGSSSHTGVIPLPAGARDNVAAAVREEFGRLNAFTLQDLNLWNSGLAPSTPPWMRSGPPATPLNPNPPPAAGAPLLSAHYGMNFSPQAFTPEPTEPATDAALFICGWQKVNTTGAIIDQFLFGPEMLPFDLLFDLCEPGNPQKFLLRNIEKREVCIGLCLIDCHTGDVLWSDIEAGYGLLNLDNPKTVKKLVDKACRKFHKCGEDHRREMKIEMEKTLTNCQRASGYRVVAESERPSDWAISNGKTGAYQTGE
jgi:hypothetical protein